SLCRREARPALLKAIDDPEGVVRAEACRALGRVGTQEDAASLARIMAADTLIDCRGAAIDALRDLQPADPPYAIALGDGMEDQAPAIRLASLQALRGYSGKDLGVEPGPWRKYAEGLASKAQPASDRPRTADRAATAVATPAPPVRQ